MVDDDIEVYRRPLTSTHGGPLDNIYISLRVERRTEGGGDKIMTLQEGDGLSQSVVLMANDFVDIAHQIIAWDMRRKAGFEDD